MGNKPSLDSGSLRAHGERRLREKEAWGIATRWRDHLQWRTRIDARLRIETDSFLHDEWTLAKSYEWIVFDIGDDEQLAAAARAAVLTWFWLSCCPGINGDENPRFWKRVFCQYQTAINVKTPVTTESIHAGVSDAMGFFNHRDRLFPRVKIISDSPQACQVFMGHTVAVHDPKLAKRLARVLRKLRPFMDDKRLSREVQVALAQEEFSFVSLWIETAQTLAGSTRTTTAFAPSFVLVGGVTNTCNMDEFNGPLASPPRDLRLDVPVAECGEYDLAKYTSAERAAWVRTIFGIDTPGGITTVRIHSFSIPRPEDAAVAGPALWSVLPHATRIATVSAPVVSRMDWAWLGYALFHPDTHASVWQKLKIHLIDVPASAVRVLELMARGNNLSMLHTRPDEPDFFNDSPHSGEYITARLHDGAVIYSEGSRDADVVLRLYGNRTVCLCVSGMDQVDGVVPAVVPGLGIGWVDTSDVASMHPRPPRAAYLRKLQLGLPRQTECGSLMVDLLSLVGARLEELDIGACPRLPESMLVPLLRACPSLRMLRVNSTGCWAFEEGDTDGLPSLEQLSLVPSSPRLSQVSDPAMQSVLRTLRFLHVRVESTDRNKLCVSTLLHRLPGLQYVHWSIPSRIIPLFVRKAGKLRYVDGLTLTHEMLGEAARVAMVETRISAAHRLAFLSVVRWMRGRSMVAHLGEDTITLIFTFATSLHRVKRTLWAEQVRSV